MRTIGVVLLMCLAAYGQSTDLPLKSRYADSDPGLDTRPDSAFWKVAVPVITEVNNYGKDVPAHHTEIRSRWTSNNLYILFSCSYLELNPKADPSVTSETNQLWERDVAEAFIGSDFENIHHYREFEMSPQGEWIDLDIDQSKKHAAQGWTWNSGFKVAARIDTASKIWYGVMQIPYRSLDDRAPAAGNQLRVNFYREQGPPPRRVEICWKPTMQRSFHAPEHFGLLTLER